MKLNEDENHPGLLQKKIELLKDQKELLTCHHSEILSKQVAQRRIIDQYRQEILTMKGLLSHLETELYNKAEQYAQVNLESEEIAAKKLEAKALHENLKLQAEQEKRLMDENLKRLTGELSSQQINDELVRSKTKINDYLSAHSTHGKSQYRVIKTMKDAGELIILSFQR